MRIHVNEASPLISVSIAGIDNRMADMSSRTFSRQLRQGPYLSNLRCSFLTIVCHCFSPAERLVERLPPEQQAGFADLLRAKGKQRQRWGRGSESPRAEALLEALANIHQPIHWNGRNAHRCARPRAY